jgi:cytochrome c biogenesis protein CcmG/thiol:disulfide interchange protein DsbE
MNKAFIPLLAFLGLAGLFLYMLGQINEGEYNPRDVPTEFIGKAAPEFSLPDLLDANHQVRPSDYQGRVWLLNVWATWCAECWREHDYLLALKRRGVTIVGVNWRDEAAEAKAMLASLGNPFERIAFDPDSQAVIEYGVYGAPETFLIDAQGIIRVKHAGAMDEQVWQEKFVPHLGGNAS